MAKKSDETLAMERLRSALQEYVALARSSTNDSVARRIRSGFTAFISEVESARASTDRILLPVATFDPFEPKTVGRMVALAMLAQPRVPLGGIRETYGSGVYAIYYQGDHPLYRAISGTETPIYVGKADPKEPDANSPREQASRLTGRLLEHAGTISEVEKYANAGLLADNLFAIRLADFYCRRLVCATNAQLVAEQHLIKTFWPLWNSNTKACWGMSKHGDAATTRKNKRSPWDVVHPGREWALNKILQDQFSPDEIEKKIAQVLQKTPPRKDHAALLEEILHAFRQDALVEDPTPVSPLGEEASGPTEDEAGIEAE